MSTIVRAAALSVGHSDHPLFSVAPLPTVYRSNRLCRRRSRTQFRHPHPLSFRPTSVASTGRKVHGSPVGGGFEVTSLDTRGTTLRTHNLTLLMLSGEGFGGGGAKNRCGYNVFGEARRRGWKNLYVRVLRRRQSLNAARTG